MQTGNPSDLAQAHRSRLVAAVLALVAGTIGAHRQYLGLRGAWLYAAVAMPLYAISLRADEWYREWSFFVAALVTVVAMGEAIRISLIDDERWDARFNRDSGIRSSHGVGPILVAIVALMLGAILGTSVLALFLERVLTPAA